MKYKSYILLLYSCFFSALFMQAQGIIIPAGSYVIAGNGNMVVSGNWVNNGSFTHNSGALVFAGAAQSLGGSSVTTFNNITTLTGSTTTITSAGHSLKGVLLSNGTLNANGNLTLLSTATQTGAVDGSGTGEVLGNLIAQRYVASGFGYKYFSSPFQNDTVGDFSNDMNLAASFPSFYKHDESLATNGWVNYTTGSGILSPLHGYAANLGSSAGAKTVDLKGVVNNHTVSYTLYNHNMAYTLGFNLVGNPYPSPINWDAAGGWTKTNIDNAVYFFNAGTTNQYTGVYSSYINGVSSDGIAGSTIAAMQGFFVHVTNGTYPVAGLLSVNNSARILNAAAAFYRAGGIQDYPLLRLSAGFADAPADPVTFYFTDDATAVFNKAADALKLMNTDSVMPNLFALSADKQKLSINARPIIKDSLSAVPLGLVTKKDGWISFTAKDIAGLPPGQYVYLSDLKTGNNQDLQKDPPYRLFLTAGDYESRFFLTFSTKELKAAGGTPIMGTGMNAYYAGGRLLVNAGLAAGEKAGVSVINMAGQTVCRQDISGQGYQSIAGTFSSAVYIVQVAGAGKIYSKKIFIGTR